MTEVRAHVWITGRVQGVGYRAATWEAATDLQLNGWVRNLPDGRVEAVFEGDRETVEQMISWCHQGPSFAVVKDVAVQYEDPEGLNSFLIQR